MTEQSQPQGGATTLPPPSANGASPQPQATARPVKAGRMHTRISGMRTALITGFVGLIVVNREHDMNSLMFMLGDDALW